MKFPDAVQLVVNSALRTGTRQHRPVATHTPKGSALSTVYQLYNLGRLASAPPVSVT